jgi:hypothetical protein
MHAGLKLTGLVGVALLAGDGNVLLEDGRGGIGGSSDLMGAMAIGAGCGSKIASLQDGLAVDTLRKERNDPRSGDPFLGDDLRIGVAAGTGVVNLRAMGGRHRVAVGCDGVGCVTGNASRQVPGFLPAATGMNAGRHLLCLAAMARRADDIAICSYYLDSVTAMAGNTIGAGAVATQFGMSALRNHLMGYAMACAAANRLGRCGVRCFRDVVMAFGADKPFVRRLNKIGRRYEQ